MTGLLLVEGNEAIKNQLMNNVPWSEYGFSPVLSADNGQDALALLERQSVGIIVIDIQMPVMSGVEFQVSAFLLKPVATKRFLDVAMRLHKEVQKEQAKEHELRALRAQAANDLLSLKEKFLTDLLHQKVAPAEISSKLEFFGLAECKDRDYQVVVMECHNGQGNSACEKDEYVLNIEFFDQAKQLLVGMFHYSLLINYNCRQLVAICFEPNENFYLYLKKYLDNLNLHFNLPFTFGVSSCFRGLQNLPMAYREAKVALQYRYIHGFNRIYFFSEIDVGHPANYKQFYQLY